MNKYIKIGAVWGIISIFGAIGGMIEVSGKISGLGVLEAIIFFLVFLAWQLTKILPENIFTGLIVLFSPIVFGALIVDKVVFLYSKSKKQ